MKKSIETLDQLSFTSIICMDITRYIYQVYSQNSILMNQVDFTNMVETYGQPIVTSNNGLVWIFKKSIEQLEDM